MANGRSIVRFDGYELDEALLELRHAGEPIAVEPQVFDVLAFLITNRNRLVAKTELLDAVWGDRFVSESALSSRIKSARKAIGDNGREQRMIRTVHGRGYQFIFPVDDENDQAPSIATDHEHERVPAGPVIDHPGAVDRLISREHEIKRALAHLETSRVVTLVGPGGVGKTRLAIEISRIWEDTNGRSAFVPLEAVVETDLLLPSICDGLGLRTETEIDPFGVLSESLRDESILLVLDNFEQLIAAGGEVSRLVAALPHLRVLVTSRDRLRLSVEQTIDVEPLALDGNDSDDPPAAVLFEQLAKQADPGFELTETNRSTVLAICDLVDGLPLAIGLAAAQLRYLSLDYLRSHLEVNAGSISDHLHDRPQRQHSVTDLIEWSYRLLTPSQQSLLARLSVFSGGWSLAGAAAVGRFDSEIEALSGLAPLVDKSLVMARSDGQAPRFSMLNLIDGYAAARLAEGPSRPEAVNDHGTYVAAMVRSIEQERWDQRAGTWIDDLSAERANIALALERAHDLGHQELVCQIIGDLNMWWYRTGRHGEGRRWIERSLADLDSIEPLVVGRLHFGAGYMAFGDRDIDRARRHYTLAIDAAVEAGDWRYEQLAKSNLSATSIRRPEETEEALRRLDDVMTAAEDRQEWAVLAHGLNTSGVLLRFDQQPELARARFEAALAANRKNGDQYQEAMNLGNLAHLAGSIDEIEGALSFARSALNLSWRIGSQVMCAWLIGQVAGFLQRQTAGGDAGTEVAARLLGASTAIVESLGAHLGSAADQAAPERARGALQEELGSSRFDELSAEGRALTLEAAVELALVPVERD